MVVAFRQPAKIKRIITFHNKDILGGSNAN
jgi:hypothetical protein